MQTPAKALAHRGQSIVEFALILPVLLLLTLGAVDAARIFTSWIALTSGVGEAALYATNPEKVDNWCSSTGAIDCPPGTTALTAENCSTVSPPPTSPFGHLCPDNDNIAYRLQVEASSLDTARITMDDPFCTDTAVPPNVVGCATAVFITVRATYEMDLIFPLISVIMGEPVQMSAAATAPLLPP